MNPHTADVIFANQPGANGRISASTHRNANTLLNKPPRCSSHQTNSSPSDNENEMSAVLFLLLLLLVKTFYHFNFFVINYWQFGTNCAVSNQRCSIHICFPLCKAPAAASQRSFANYLPSDHLLSDRSPNLGPLISRWDINKFENC